jgi:hypothetical protein
MWFVVCYLTTIVNEIFVFFSNGMVRSQRTLRGDGMVRSQRTLRGDGMVRSQRPYAGMIWCVHYAPYAGYADGRVRSKRTRLKARHTDRAIQG